MIKGFINFKNGRIPFVIDNFKMALFTDGEILSDFTKAYNNEENYILHGQYFGDFAQPQKITILVEYSIGYTCYLLCYIIEKFSSLGTYNTIGFQSPFLDDIFRFRYNYLDCVSSGTNLEASPKEIYRIPFLMEDKQYNLSFRIGHDSRLGLLEDLNRWGEVQIPLFDCDIQECYKISKVMQRFISFMVSYADMPFKRIVLYKGTTIRGWYYSRLLSESTVSGQDLRFYAFDVNKYVPKVLNNIAKDTGNSITESVPVGHLMNMSLPYTPQKFIEQITAFEYLFEKLEPKKARDKHFPLQKELQLEFDIFPEILSDSKTISKNISEKLKELRRCISHGYVYYCP